MALCPAWSKHHGRPAGVVVNPKGSLCAMHTRHDKTSQSATCTKTSCGLINLYYRHSSCIPLSRSTSTFAPCFHVSSVTSWKKGEVVPSYPEGSWQKCRLSSAKKWEMLRQLRDSFNKPIDSNQKVQRTLLCWNKSGSSLILRHNLE